MKINKKEQNLLAILGVILIVFGYYKFVLDPQTKKVKELEAKRNELTTKVEAMKKNVASYSEKEKEYKIQNSKIVAKSERILPAIMQEKIIVTLDELLDKTKLDGYSLSFSEGKSGTADKAGTTEKDKTSEATASAEKNPKTPATGNVLKPEIASVVIPFRGSFAVVKDFIYTLENASKKTVITGISLGASKENELVGNVNLEFYALPGIPVTDKEYLNWNYNNKYGKEQPFIAEGTGNLWIAGAGVPAVSGENAGEVKKAAEVKQEPKYDFIMSVKPTTFDLPSIILGKTLDSTRNSYVYADSGKIEPVEVYFTQANGKYYYKYKTSREMYPKQWNGTGTEFTPAEGTINFKIYSNKRTSPSDEAGAKVKLVNGTDKAVNVTIEGEDSARPRVQIVNEGNVQVKVE